MWDDLGTVLTGAGPTATVQDPDGTPNNILDVADGGAVEVAWSFKGTALGFLDLAEFTVQLWADPVGLGTNHLVGQVLVAGTLAPVTPPGPKGYAANIAIAPNSLAIGAYRLTTLITCTNGGVSVPVAGFVDGLIIQVRPGP